jgi:hypothetical protein
MTNKKERTLYTLKELIYSSPIIHKSMALLIAALTPKNTQPRINSLLLERKP